MQLVSLINYAWIWSGIVPRNLASVTNNQTSDGLYLLNFLLNDIGMTGRHVPYYQYPEIDTVVGQEIYFVEGAVVIETCTFNIGPVRYAMDLKNRKHYFGAPRVDKINPLPFTFYWERVIGGCNLYVYFLPQQVFQLKIKLKALLGNYTTAQYGYELDNDYDAFYQNYLTILLAKYMCMWYKISMPPDAQEKLNQYQRQLADMNYMDLTMKKKATLSQTATITFAQVNIGRGWVPGQ